MASLRAHARIKPRVQDVAQDRRDDEDKGEEKDQHLHGRDVGPKDRLVGQAPQTVECKDAFGDDRTAQLVAKSGW